MMFFFQLFFPIKVNLHVHIINYKASIIFSPFPRRKNLTILRNIQLGNYYFHNFLDVVFEVDYKLGLLFVRDELIEPITSITCDLGFYALFPRNWKGTHAFFQEWGTIWGSISQQSLHCGDIVVVWRIILESLVRELRNRGTVLSWISKLKSVKHL